MKKLINEFKEFALKGSMFDMAIGLIMGSAFSGLINSLVETVFNPLLALICGGSAFEDLSFKIFNTTFPVGQFISTLVNFFLMALVLFLLVKAMNKLRDKTAPKKPAATKPCPYCQSDINVKATRCPNCTSILEGYKNAHEK